MIGVILLLHIVGFSLLLGAVVPKHYSLGGDHQVYTVGVGLLAYTLGLRHAFDADHIAAIDSTTRKLTADLTPEGVGGRPLSVGFWFSLGHSTIVFALTLLLSVGVRALAGPLEDDNSMLHSMTGVIGASVSGLFLWALGILNLVVLVGIVRVFRHMRTGVYDEAELEAQLDRRGFMNRFLGRLTRSVRTPRHIYPVGVLFGLGFDTATEVALLVLAGGAAAFSLPFYAVLVLPVLFAAGMCLMDTAEGILMNGAYGWAFARPVRKIYYNITITTLSVVTALVIGTIELLGVLVDRAGISRGPLAAVAHIPLDRAGYAIVALFLARGGWRLSCGTSGGSKNAGPSVSQSRLDHARLRHSGCLCGGLIVAQVDSAGVPGAVSWPWTSTGTWTPRPRRSSMNRAASGSMAEGVTANTCLCQRGENGLTAPGKPALMALTGPMEMPSPAAELGRSGGYGSPHDGLEANTCSGERLVQPVAQTILTCVVDQVRAIQIVKSHGGRLRESVTQRCSQHDLFVEDGCGGEPLRDGRRHERHIDLPGVDEAQHLVDGHGFAKGDRHIWPAAVPIPHDRSEHRHAEALHAGQP